MERAPCGTCRRAERGALVADATWRWFRDAGSKWNVVRLLRLVLVRVRSCKVLRLVTLMQGAFRATCAVVAVRAT